ATITTATVTALTFRAATGSARAIVGRVVDDVVCRGAAALGLGDGATAGRLPVAVVLGRRGRGLDLRRCRGLGSRLVLADLGTRFARLPAEQFAGRGSGAMLALRRDAHREIVDLRTLVLGDGLANVLAIRAHATGRRGTGQREVA